MLARTIARCSAMPSAYASRSGARSRSQAVAAGRRCCILHGRSPRATSARRAASARTSSPGSLGDDLRARTRHRRARHDRHELPGAPGTNPAYAKGALVSAAVAPGLAPFIARARRRREPVRGRAHVHGPRRPRGHAALVRRRHRGRSRSASAAPRRSTGDSREPIFRTSISARSTATALDLPLLVGLAEPRRPLHAVGRSHAAASSTSSSRRSRASRRA